MYGSWRPIQNQLHCRRTDSDCQELGIHIIAEGVETENQLNALNNYQCEYQQGFYYAPTMEQDVLIKVMGTTLDESRVTIEEEKLKMKM